MKLIYENPLATPEDVKDFVLEGKANISFENGRLRMANQLSEVEGQKANYVYWCDKEFPADIRIEWDFLPVQEPGLAMMFFAAKGRGGEDLFAPSLAPRNGEYKLYHHGDIDAFHVSYFRRKEPDERHLHTCNLRKSYGFYLVAQGADPIPDAVDATVPYHIVVTKYKNKVTFDVENLRIFEFVDDGESYGKILGGGKLGFRQLAPMIAEYSNLIVFELEDDDMQFEKPDQKQGE